MKKTYMMPDTKEVRVNIQHHLLSGSDMNFGALNEVKNASEGTSNGGWNARGNDSFWDDEEY